jgi:heterodisulfide reductase subunit A
MSGGDVRIGVFICNCGTNIAGFLEAREVAEYAGTLPGVVFQRENLYSCSEAGIGDIKAAIRENDLNRVVVAACTPRTHEPTFRAACQDAGLNPYLFEFVNIREHCSWVHKEEREAATAKAKALVRMAVARVALLEPAERIRTDVERHAVVIGGGVSGMTASLALAKKGLSVTLIERDRSLGGLVRGLDRLHPSGRDADAYADSLAKRVRAERRISPITRATVRNVAGYIGNYTVTVRSGGKDRDVKCGAIVVATGARPLDPEGLYGHDGKRVITLFELESRLKKGKPGGKRFVMIQCAGARTPERVYCSKICCASAIKDALAIRKLVPDSTVHVLYRDLMCYGVENEELLRRAKEKGVRFVNFADDAPPVIEDGVVKVAGQVVGRELEIPADTVVLATPLVARDDAGDVSKMLKVPLDEDRFFLEAHVKLRPVDFATDGIYVCGAARWPATTRECVEQALGAAARASIPLLAGEVEVEPAVARLLDPELCRGCGMCAAICPYGAIEMVETEDGTKAEMIEVACKGCGTCAATCYKRAITMVHYTDEQIGAQVRAAFAE